MALRSWLLHTHFGEDYYYPSISQVACTLYQPITVETDRPSWYYSRLLLHNGFMGPKNCQGQKVFAL